MAVFTPLANQIEDLAIEMEDWREAWEGTNFEQTNKYDEVEEAAKNLSLANEKMEEALFYLDDVDIPTGNNK